MVTIIRCALRWQYHYSQCCLDPLPSLTLSIPPLMAPSPPNFVSFLPVPLLLSWTHPFFPVPSLPAKSVPALPLLASTTLSWFLPSPSLSPYPLRHHPACLVPALLGSISRLFIVICMHPNEKKNCLND